MKRYIPFARVEGQASRQAHADIPPGTFEREISKEGFFGPAAFFYHRHPPTAWTDFEGPLRPRAFDLARFSAAASSPWDALPVLHNAHMRLRLWITAGAMPCLARNADGDELLFVHEGEGDLFCDYGHLSFAAGDYLLIPRGTLWRIEAKQPVAALLIQCTNSSYSLPDRGMLGAHAVFDPAVLDVPVMNERFRAQQSDTQAWQVQVKCRDVVSTITYPFNPLDAVGWHGDLSVVRLNVADIRPVMSARYHLPPSAHTTFLGERFVVCTFAPRPFETDPGALKVPFFHSNDDYDEILFYHAGDFFSRDNIHPGMLTLHPSGFTHGPHPKALENMLVQSKPGTDEYAVMIDTRDPVTVDGGMTDLEWFEYVNSWKSEPSS